MKYGIDLGFGFVKVVSSSGEKHRFQSVLAKKTGNGIGGFIMGSNDDFVIDITDQNTNETTSYYVGENAVTNGGTRKWDNKGIFNSEDMKCFIATAVALAYKPTSNNEKNQLVVGLPVSYFQPYKDNLVELLSNLNLKVTLSGIRIKSKEVSISFDDVVCVPQGVGAYYSGVLDLEGNIKDRELMGESVGVIDIGFRTVDFLVMQKAKTRVTYVDYLSGSLEEEGMNKFYQIVDRMVEADHGIALGVTEIEKALEWFNGTLKYQKKIIDLTKYEEVAVRELAEEIGSKIKQKWGKSADMLDRIFITGGGGNSLYEILKNHFPQAELQDSSSYANCLGYLGLYSANDKSKAV